MNDADLKQELRVYVEVFKIPPQSCPPDYFTLLGLGKDCTDAEAITGASKKRASLLNKTLPAELHLAARMILRRMERARICLSDPSSRAAYLSKLYGRSANLSLTDSTSTSLHRVDASSPQAVRPRTAPNLKSQKYEHANLQYGDSITPDLPATSTTSRSRRTIDDLAKGISDGPILDLGPTTHINLTQPRNNSQLPLYTLVGVVGLAVVALIVFGLSGETDTPSTPSVVASATPNEVTEQKLNLPSEVEEPASIPSEAYTTEKQSADQRPSRVTPEISITPDHLEDSAQKQTNQGEESNSPSSPASEASTNPQKVPEVENQPVVQVISLASLEKEIALPLFDEKKSSASSGDDGKMEEAKLGSVSDFTHQQLQITLAQPTIAKFPGAEFYVREEIDGQELKAWEIRLKSAPTKDTKADEEKSEVKGDAPAGSALDKLASEFDVLVALICFEESYLKFQWEVVEDRRFADQLRNCILLLKAGNETAKIQLRPTKDVGAFVTNLTERNHLYDLAEIAVPSAEALQLRVHDVNLAGVDFEVDPASATASFGDTVEIKLLGWQGDASLRFSLVGKKESPTVRFTPRYKIGGKRNAPLTSQDVRSSIENVQNALADGRGRLAFAERQVDSLPGAISSVWARDDGSNTAKVKAEASRLERQLQSAEGTIKRMARSIPDMEATIAGLEALASLARRFDQQGSIEFEVIVPCNDEELVLLSTSSGSP